MSHCRLFYVEELAFMSGRLEHYVPLRQVKREAVRNRIPTWKRNGTSDQLHNVSTYSLLFDAVLSAKIPSFRPAFDEVEKNCEINGKIGIGEKKLIYFLVTRDTNIGGYKREESRGWRDSVVPDIELRTGGSAIVAAAQTATKYTVSEERAFALEQGAGSHSYTFLHLVNSV